MVTNNDRRPAIEVKNVSKYFGSGKDEVHAVQDVNLKVESGELISLIGPSGCGKSTLLRILGDLIHPTSGSVQINGKDVKQARADRDYGIVFQAPVLFEWRNIRHNIELPLQVMGYPQAGWDERVGDMLKLVGLEDFDSKHPWQLSGGMQQRVAIARALSFQPSILLMDEPFGALDELTREYINLELLDIFTRTNISIVFVTHSIPEAVFLSNRVLVMSHRPGTINNSIKIDLPYPRSFETREMPRYYELVTKVREAMKLR